MLHYFLEKLGYQVSGRNAIQGYFIGLMFVLISRTPLIVVPKLTELCLTNL